LAADLVYTSDGPLHESGASAIYYGVRGMLALEMSLQTAAGDNHSGNKGGVIPNAAWELVKILSSMRDEQDRVRVKGFNDQVRPPTAKDPPEIFELLKQHIQGMHPGVQVTRQGYMYPSRTDPGLEGM